MFSISNSQGRQRTFEGRTEENLQVGGHVINKVMLKC